MAALSRRAPLSLNKTLFYLEQVCSGLAHAHECGVIHRDIKPQNLLLTGDRQVVKIADFGVARLAATEGAITRVGTNIYSAPEHNPLVLTGSLDLGIIAASGGSHHEYLTPAARHLFACQNNLHFAGWGGASQIRAARDTGTARCSKWTILDGFGCEGTGKGHPNSPR